MQKTNFKLYFFIMIRLIISFVVLLIGTFLVLTHKPFDTEYNYIENFDYIQPLIVQKDDVLEQKVSFAGEELRNLGFGAVNRSNDCKGTINISLIDDDNVIYENDVNVRNLSLGYIYWIETDVIIEKGKEYLLKIYADNMEGVLYVDGVTQEDNSSVAIGVVDKNSEQMNLSLALESAVGVRLGKNIRLTIAVWTVILIVCILRFEYLFGNKIIRRVSLFILLDALIISLYYAFDFKFDDIFKYSVFIVIVMLFAIVAIIYMILIAIKCKKAELYFVVSTLIFGVIYSCLLPPFSAPDEPFHFAQAYRLSNAILSQPINNENGYIYMRECDVQYYEKYPNAEYTADIMKKLIGYGEEVGEDYVQNENNVASGYNTSTFMPAIVYLPQAIGITLGRVLHMNYVRLVYAGRLMNLLVFTVITAMAIKITPFGKWIIFSICQIPLLLEVVSSYSYDAMVLACTFLFVAIVMKIIGQDNRASIRQKILLIILAFIYAPMKFVYLPLIALVFIIDNDKFDEHRYRGMLWKVAIFGVAIISFVLVQKFSFMSISNVANKTSGSSIENIVELENDELEINVFDTYTVNNTYPLELPNIKFIINNPFDIIKSYTEAFVENFDEYLLSMFGNYLGWYAIRIPVWISIMVMILLGYSYMVSGNESSLEFGYIKRMIVLTIMVGSVLTVFFSFYITLTIPAIKGISGVQGRYMIPILAVLPLLIKGKCGTDWAGQSVGGQMVNVAMISLTIQILIILNIYRVVW